MISLTSGFKRRIARTLTASLVIVMLLALVVIEAGAARSETIRVTAYEPLTGKLQGITSQGKLAVHIDDETGYELSSKPQEFPPGPCHSIKERWDGAVANGAKKAYFNQLLSGMVGPGCRLVVVVSDHDGKVLRAAPAP